MLLVCVLVPFMHVDTFKPSNVVQTTVDKDFEKEVITLAMQTFVSKHKFQEVKLKNRLLIAQSLD